MLKQRVARLAFTTMVGVLVIIICATFEPPSDRSGNTHSRSGLRADGHVIKMLQTSYVMSGRDDGGILVCPNFVVRDRQ